MSNRNFNYTRIPSAFNGPNDTNNKIPMLFQVLSPDMETLLFPYALYLHVNPQSLDVSYSKNINRVQTLGGFVEQHFGENLTDISASGSTGAFISVEEGVTALNRRNTIAYRKMLQIIDLFKSNGSVYDDKGMVQFRGRIQITFGGGIYEGYFTTLDIAENGEQPFNLQVSWSFKVEKEKYALVY
jgi:hypothetical protein